MVHNMRAVWACMLHFYFSFLKVSAPTWIEQLRVIGQDGTYSGGYGYARGFVDRTHPRFDGFSNKWQIPDPATGKRRINMGMDLCHPWQRSANYSSRHPQLYVTPGQHIALKYLENGHVTRPLDPQGKPSRGGTVWVYATHSPQTTETLYEVLQWSPDGTGGDSRGWLLAAQDFDDGRCHKLSDAEDSQRRQSRFPNHLVGQPDMPVEQWCETDVKVPVDTPVNSTLTMYWVWGWGTTPGSANEICGKDEYYVSCLDVKIGRKGSFHGSEDCKLNQQDPQISAVRNYKHRTALQAEPTIVSEDACDVAVTSAYTSSSLPTEQAKRMYKNIP